MDQEADEDEEFRDSHPETDRLPSPEANKELTEKAERYRAILQQAGESDELVRQKWEQWEDNIVQLTWTEVSPRFLRTCCMRHATNGPGPLGRRQSDLESAIPSSTVSPISRTASGGVDPTRAHARALRVQLEKLDDLTKSREELVSRVHRAASDDDVTARILKAASAMEQWVSVQPAMFEDILDEELSKFDKFRVQLEDNEKKQTELLHAVLVRPSRVPLSGIAEIYTS